MSNLKPLWHRKNGFLNHSKWGVLMEMYLNVIKACALFEDKNKSDIEIMLKLTQHKVCKYKKNDFVIPPNAPFHYLGIVLEGSIEVRNNLESGRLVNITYKNKSEVFGCSFVFSKDYKGQFEIIAKEPCILLLIDKKSVLEVLLKDSIIASNILDIFSNEIINLNKKIVLFSYSLIQEKIARFLLNNTESDNTSTIELPYSKKALAERLNVPRSNLSRELKKLSMQGIIEIDHKTIRILDKPQLEAILSN
jgi:CRP-like cAMP-binding protein